MDSVRLTNTGVAICMYFGRFDEVCSGAWKFTMKTSHAVVPDLVCIGRGGGYRRKSWVYTVNDRFCPLCVCAPCQRKKRLLSFDSRGNPSDPPLRSDHQ